MAERIEVRYSHTALGPHVPFKHKYIVYTDSDGNEYASRGGPGYFGPGAEEGQGVPSTSYLGNITTSNDDYDENHPDWDTQGDDPSETIIEGEDLSEYWQAIKDAMDDIEGEMYPYLPFNNSNTAVDEALRRSGLPEPELDDFGENFSPGSGRPLIYEGGIPRDDETPGSWPETFESAEDILPPPTCPLVLDLVGNGTESRSVTSGAYFDFNADGFAEATGWAGPDDGLLVWDRDSDGRIGSGRELFGNETLLQSGQLAANGFAALAEWDANSDGKIDASDAVWTNLNVWVDANGDGFSVPDELLTLGEAGVAAINISYVNGPGVDVAGNEEWLTGSFTRTDASTGEVTDYRFARDLARAIPAEWLEVPTAIFELPVVRGFGTVYDLHQAMARDATGALQALVEDFVAETVPATRNALLEQIVLKWTGAEPVDPASRGANIDARYLGALEAFMGRAFVGAGGSGDPSVPAATLLNNAYTNLSESVYAQLMAQTHLKPFYDQVVYSWNATSESVVGDLGAVKAELEDMIAQGNLGDVLTAAEFVRTVRGFGAENSLNLSSFQSSPALALLANNSYQMIAGTEGADTLVGVSTTNVVSALGGDDSITTYDNSDLIHGGDGNDTIQSGNGNDVVYGGMGDDTIQAEDGDDLVYGSDGNDTLDGGKGVDTLVGGAGNDVLGGANGTYDWASWNGSVYVGNIYEGGTGNDVLRGTIGADVYHFNVGDGQDLIQEGNASGSYTDRLVFGAGIEVGDVLVTRWVNDLTLHVGTNGDQIRVQDWYSGLSSQLEQVEFDGGGMLTAAQLSAMAVIGGTEGDDNIVGSISNDTIYGFGGNDTLDGGKGVDTLVGGAGNDVLGGANGTYDWASWNGSVYVGNIYEGGTGNDVLRGTIGADVYHFNVGDGQDLIQEGNASGSYTDRLVFGAGIEVGDVLVTRWVNDLTLRVGTNGDQIRVQDWYSGLSSQLEQVEFDGGGMLTAAQLSAMAVIGGTEGDDSIVGSTGNDTIYGFGGNDTMTGGSGNDYFAGGADNDSADGGDGTDVLQGEAGDDLVAGGAGNDLLTGDAGDDVLDGGDGDDLLAGGTGNDTVNTGGGNNVIAYNAGGGIDTVFAGAGAANTLSFGGGIGYDDLSLSKDGNDLIVSAGENDRVVLKDWYAGSESVLNLQIILDASDEFDANSSDPLYNKKVQTFDFAGLVSEFDEALAQSPGLTSWAVTNALLQFHLSGADDAAIGGDLAYWYGKNNGFTGISLAAAQQAIGAPGFGSDAQSLQPFSGLQEGLVKLA